ncbi:MAG: hypothetical protein LBJ97_02490 [Mycoplasmataceae bacterium]|jgi:hypothetical protein|nr:hypothetical protein [Mycoplasmataceae bacterium]
MKYKYSITKRIDKNNGEVEVMKIGTKEPTVKILLKQILATQLEHTEMLKEHTTMLKSHTTMLKEHKDMLKDHGERITKLENNK